ncbi:hypothetical protein B5M09_008576, partial [Aphanomyces astaci]
WTLSCREVFNYRHSKTRIIVEPLAGGSESGTFSPSRWNSRFLWSTSSSTRVAPCTTLYWHAAPTLVPMIRMMTQQAQRTSRMSSKNSQNGSKVMTVVNGAMCLPTIC